MIQFGHYTLKKYSWKVCFSLLRAWVDGWTSVSEQRYAMMVETEDLSFP